MSLIGNSTYIAAFGLGTVVGAASAYFIVRLKPILMKSHFWQDGMEERYEFEDVTDEYRLILAIRQDLKMQKGKVAAQCGHASVAAYAKAMTQTPQTLKKWLKYGGTKITVKIDSEEEMLALDKAARQMKVLTSIIRDAGQTQVPPGTKTVIAIGPAPKSVLNKITGHLKLY